MSDTIQQSVLGRLSNDLAEAVERAGAATVTVNARKRMPATGIIWSADGLIVTANHVVERDEEISVGLADGRTVDAKLLGRDPGSDLALLKIEAADYASFERLLSVAQLSFSRGDVAALRSATTPEMLGYFTDQLDDNTKRGLRNEIADPTWTPLKPERLTRPKNSEGV